jgi:hypothetical protein
VDNVLPPQRNSAMPMHDWTKVNAGVFHDFHLSWIASIRNALNSGLLPAGYYAMAEQVADGPIPDVLALEEFDRRTSGSSNEELGVALADSPPKVQYTLDAERELYADKANRVAVYCSTGDRVVAYIEIVSSGNKHSESNVEKFLDKLSDALRANCHLLVIDPYPPTKRDPLGLHARFWNDYFGGAETPGVSQDRPLGLIAYRADLTPTAYFETLAVNMLLTDMPLFLDPDHYINVPLEMTYAQAWESVAPRWKRVIEN